MTSSSKNTWTLAPHQHQGPHQETGEDAHILSPEKHNGNFKAEGVLTFMGVPYCAPDRHEIRKMGAKLAFTLIYQYLGSRAAKLRSQNQAP